MLDFWATWCGPCVQAFPHLIEATTTFSPDEVLFIGVNQQEQPQTIKDFLESHGWEAKIALDRDGAVARAYQVDGIPQTVVIGKGGRIEKVNLGYRPNLGAELNGAIQQLLDAGDGPSGNGQSEPPGPPHAEKSSGQ